MQHGRRIELRAKHDEAKRLPIDHGDQIGRIEGVVIPQVEQLRRIGHHRLIGAQGQHRFFRDRRFVGEFDRVHDAITRRGVGFGGKVADLRVADRVVIRIARIYGRITPHADEIGNRAEDRAIGGQMAHAVRLREIEQGDRR